MAAQSIPPSLVLHPQQFSHKALEGMVRLLKGSELDSTFSLLDKVTVLELSDFYECPALGYLAAKVLCDSASDQWDKRLTKRAGKITKQCTPHVREAVIRGWQESNSCELYLYAGATHADWRARPFQCPKPHESWISGGLWGSRILVI